MLWASDKEILLRYATGLRRLHLTESIDHDLYSYLSIQYLQYPDMATNIASLTSPLYLPKLRILSPIMAPAIACAYILFHPYLALDKGGVRSKILSIAARITLTTSFIYVSRASLVLQSFQIPFRLNLAYYHPETSRYMNQQVVEVMI